MVRCCRRPAELQRAAARPAIFANPSDDAYRLGTITTEASLMAGSLRPVWVPGEDVDGVQTGRGAGPVLLDRLRVLRGGSLTAVRWRR